MSVPPPPGYGTLPPDPDDPQPGPYPAGQNPDAPYPGAPAPGAPQPGPRYPGTPYPAAPAPGVSNPYGPAPSSSSTKNLGIISLVLGLVSVPFACCCILLAWIPAVAAIVTGAVGLGQVRQDPAQADAKPFLVAGVVLGCVALLLMVAAVVLRIVGQLNDF